jgi:hypothetical protein
MVPEWVVIPIAAAAILEKNAYAKSREVDAMSVIGRGQNG